MRAHIPGRYAALALLLGGLACASNKANTDEGSVVAQDSTKANNDTSAYKAQPRDTMAVPTDTTHAAPTPTPTDTTQAAPAPTPTPADTTQYQPQAAPTPTDTSSYVPQKSSSDTGAAVQPTSPAPTTPSDSGWKKDTTKAQ
jgi:hypothetical protein